MWQKHTHKPIKMKCQRQLNATGWSTALYTRQNHNGIATGRMSRVKSSITVTLTEWKCTRKQYITRIDLIEWSALPNAYGVMKCCPKAWAWHGWYNWAKLYGEETRGLVDSASRLCLSCVLDRLNCQVLTLFLHINNVPGVLWWCKSHYSHCH